MKTIVIAFSIVLLFTLFVAQSGEKSGPLDAPVIVTSGFGTGNDYMAMSVREKYAYVMGAINGMLMAPVFGAPEKNTKWFTDYIKGMTNKQVVAILTKFLDDNPGRWHEPLNLLTYDAMQDAYDKANPPANHSK